MKSKTTAAWRADADARQTILRAAIGVFAAKGLDGATIRDLGRAAGLNSGHLYYYFEDKRALFLAAVELVMGDFMARLRRHPPRFADGRERLRFIVRTGFTYYGEHPERLRLMTVVIALHREIFAAGIRHLVQEHRFTPFDLIRDARRTNQWRPVNPVQAWWSIVGTCLLTLHTADIFAGASDLVPEASPAEAGQRIEQIVDMLYEGLRPRPARARRHPRKEAP